MAVKSGENTESIARFRAALNKWVDRSDKTKGQIAELLGFKQGNLSNFLSGKRSISLAGMEEIAVKIDKDLTDMLAEGRTLLAGEQQTPIMGQKENAETTVLGAEMGRLKEEVAGLKDENLALHRELAEHKRKTAAAAEVELKKAQ